MAELAAGTAEAALQRTATDEAVDANDDTAAGDAAEAAAVAEPKPTLTLTPAPAPPNGAIAGMEPRRSPPPGGCSLSYRRGARSKILGHYISVSAEIEMKIERDRYAAATQDDNQFEIWRWRNFVNLCSKGSYKAPCDGCTSGDCNTKKWFGE